MINGATCNATDDLGCADTATVAVGSGPGAVALDPQTHTAYVANYNDRTVSVIDTATCNATDSSDCGATLPTVTVGPQPSALVVDPASDTVYVQTSPTGDGSLGLVYMINGATCDAAVTSGCGQAPRTAAVGSGPIWMAENPATRTVYAVNEEDSSLSVIDAATCNATDSIGCQQVPPALSIGGRSSVTPSYPDFGAGAVAVDASTDTLYATSQSENNVSVLNGATCNATNTSGCTRFAPTTTVGNGPSAIAVDPATQTLYVGNQNDQSVSVINAAVCNVSNQAGCKRAWPTIHVGLFPQWIAVDQRTDTLYVANAGFQFGASDTISVINGSSCNATVTWGCNQTPVTVTVGVDRDALAVDQRTDTIYVANNGTGSAPGDTISVIDGATCNGTLHSGCSRTPATIGILDYPSGVAVDDRTNTIYVTDGNDNVSVINGATCNGTVSTGCAQTPSGGAGRRTALRSCRGSAHQHRVRQQHLGLRCGNDRQHGLQRRQHPRLRY
jgi:YVTN family beta-propeller protein